MEGTPYNLLQENNHKEGGDSFALGCVVRFAVHWEWGRGGNPSRAGNPHSQPTEGVEENHSHAILKTIDHLPGHRATPYFNNKVGMSTEPHPGHCQRERL